MAIWYAYFMAIWYAYFVAIWYAYVMAIWYILWPFGIFYGHLVFFPRFGFLYQEKSGNPGKHE
jgi:hypothetical protein